MAKFYFIRHGKPDYTYGDTHGFIGQGHDFAPLKTEKIEEVIEAAKDKRLKDAQIIISSPYTRALQTASIISKETGIDIVVESDIMEWQPDLTYDTVIIVAHKITFQSICNCGDMKPAQIFETEF